MKSVFLLFFYIQILFKFQAPLLFFQIKTMIYREKTLHRKNMKKNIELHVVHTRRHTQTD